MTRNPSVFNKKIIAALWLCLVVLAAVLAPASAFAETNGKRTIRVGWFESTFNMTDRFGRRLYPKKDKFYNPAPLFGIVAVK